MVHMYDWWRSLICYSIALIQRQGFIIDSFGSGQCYHSLFYFLMKCKNECYSNFVSRLYRRQHIVTAFICWMLWSIRVAVGSENWNIYIYIDKFVIDLVIHKMYSPWDLSHSSIWKMNWKTSVLGFGIAGNTKNSLTAGCESIGIPCGLSHNGPKRNNNRGVWTHYDLSLMYNEDDGWSLFSLHQHFPLVRCRVHWFACASQYPIVE